LNRALVASLLLFPALAQDAKLAQLQRDIEQVADSIGGIVGVSIRHAESGEQISIHGRERFPMASVYKFPIAIAFLSQVDAGSLRMDQPVRIAKSDLRGGHSPIADRYPQGGATMTAGQLAEAMVNQSDNTACDLIVRLIGGPAVVNSKLRELGINGVSVNRPEGDLMKVGYDPGPGNFDTAAPDAMVALLLRAQARTLQLKPATSELLLRYMTNTQTPERLKSLLPAGTVVAHKSGTAGNRIVNDVGILTLPGKAGHIAIAVFIRNSGRPVAQQEQAIGRIARAAYDFWTAPR
jgi:beta-lactamase class A